MLLRYSLALLMLIAVAVFRPDVAVSDSRHIFVVISPPPRPQSAPAQSFPTQPPLQWAPFLPLGAIPGRRSPAARCYADGHDCPLERSDRVGESCTCGGAVLGRALIPPSHDTAGRPVQFTN